MSHKLFDAWTWHRKLPAPFDTITNKVRTDIGSMYNTTKAAKATLHSPVLSAVLAYAGLDAGTAGVKGAIGTQNNDFIIGEYPSHKSGETHAAVFNKQNGKFFAGVFTGVGSNPDAYVMKEDGNSGSALFFALMPVLLDDKEFSDNYADMLECVKDGFSDMNKAETAAFMLCDNAYRRIEGGEKLNGSGVKVSVSTSGNIPPFTPLNLQKNIYAPTNTLLGNFEVFTPGAAPAAPGVFTRHDDFVGKYAMTERKFSPDEQSLIPTLPSWYIIPQEVIRICQHAKVTTASQQPMRNFMMRGPAGTGKTEGVKAIAAGLGLPYVHITCSANTEIFDLLGQILPDMDGEHTELSGASELPTFDDIRFDPPTAYDKLTGIYDENVTEEAVYDKLLEVIKAQAASETEKPETEQKQKFRYVDTPFVKAMRYGYVVELQEPSIISNPGVLVGLNSLLDRCESITLPTGEKIKRHPDTIVVVTTNNDYAGCKAMNQSVISRMNLVLDIEEPDAETLTKRVAGITGCTDTAAVRKMAETIKEISERCRETMITDGCCGVRELISWVQSFMICGNELEAAKYTVLASVSSDPENRAEILESCLNTKFT